MTARPAPPSTPQAGDRVFLVDANNLVHRLYHASAPRFAPNDQSTPINAVIAWGQRMRALRLGHDPAFLLPIFDGPGDSWRRALAPDYKATRKGQPDELRGQWEPIWHLSQALGLSPLHQPGLEADDLIGAYANACVDAELEVTIVSNDSDLMQLVRGPDRGPGSVRQLDAFTGKRVGPVQVEAKFGVPPERLPELFALAGSKSDGVPGIPGIGPKIATELLATYGSLEGVLDNAALIPQRKRSERILAHRDDARLSLQLTALRVGEPLPLPLDELKRWRPSRRALDAFFGAFGFPNFRAAMDGPAPAEPPGPGYW